MTGRLRRVDGEGVDVGDDGPQLREPGREGDRVARVDVGGPTHGGLRDGRRKRRTKKRRENSKRVCHERNRARG